MLISYPGFMDNASNFLCIFVMMLISYACFCRYNNITCNMHLLLDKQIQSVCGSGYDA